MKDTMETFSIDGILHEVGNIECSACEGGILGPCKTCQGLVHIQIIDQYTGSYIQKCDVCR